MIAERESRVVSAVSTERVSEISTGVLHFHRNPLIRAVALFERGIGQQFLLLDLAALKATQALDRVLTAYKARGSSIWQTMLNHDSKNIISDENLEGFELVNLFLSNPQISYDRPIQEYYHEERLRVVRGFLKYIPEFSLDQIRDIYDHIGLHPQKDGTLVDTTQLRTYNPLRR